MTEQKKQFDCIILGAGAAGLMCAIEAGKRGRRVAVIDHADRPGKKILISGGGRCNFTNLYCSPDRFLSSNPHFAKSALALYTPQHFLELIHRYNIAYHEKTLGQLFCDSSAHDVLNMLLQECEAYGVTLILKRTIREVTRSSDFALKTQQGDVLTAPALVVATGGLSIPKMGATPLGYDIARQFSLEIVTPRPALVPFVFSKEDCQLFCDLSGVSAEVIASIGRMSFREKLLITHRGLSGPAILQISSYWHPEMLLSLDLLPEIEPVESLFQPRARRDLHSLRASLRAHLPQRLADRLMEVDPPAAWSNHALQEYQRRLHDWKILPEGTEGFEKAEVTAGGVATHQLSARTMECRDVPGLFFIGEVVDVTGHLGGFNFQWAWASAVAAGRNL
jgi:predicted Rossmann fold flavoprotein